MRVWPGDPAPLGATFDGLGTNIAVFSNVAESISVCVFDADGNEECVELPERSGAVFHGYFPDLEAGSHYGLRVDGPYEPSAGNRCDPSKLLIDPYARAINGFIDWDPSVFAYRFDDPAKRNQDDSAAFVPKSVVVNPYFDWAGDTALRHQWSDTVIYEAHVKGATMLHPDVPEDLRGTYAGIGDPAFVDHLTSLGVTALELLPVHHFVHEQHLLDRGLRNYWGYHTIGYFAPHHDYSSRGTNGHQVHEFKQMVKTLHSAGIEVILDVVYNHTGEGNERGPTLSMRGIDNAAYYRLVADDPQYYMDYTGTGNTLNMRDAYVLQLVMDSLRYWATEMHVDGFRFDLASALARSLHEVDRLSAFFDLVQQDPVISRLKLIAEPWDIGEGGYQVGNFPAQWAEWNGRYRDCIRDHWAGNSPGLGEFAYRITGSSDLYEAAGRRPHASINFVTAHDGFTIRDLVSYNDKHNDANGEGGNDGESHNRSWNCGVEGPTDDEEVNALRSRQQRNFLATLLLSQGVPMVLGGDELGRTQGGNNNGYCQDNEISWFDWEHVDAELLDFTRQLMHFRRDHKVFRRRQFFQGRALHGEGVGDIVWYNPNGAQMGDDDWTDGNARALGLFLSGDHLETDGRGNQVDDESFLLLFNAADSGVEFVLPGELPFVGWQVAVATEAGVVDPVEPELYDAGTSITLGGRSLVALRGVGEPEDPLG